MRGECAQPPGSNVQNRAGFLGNADKSPRLLQAERPVVPAQQSLGTDHLARTEIDLGLVVEQKFLVCDGGLEIACQPDAIARVALVGSGVGMGRMGGNGL